jgi:PilZ domain-containing protein
MQLPVALFEQITSSLSGEVPACPESQSESDPSASQRRREPRMGVRAHVTVIPLTDSLAAAPFEAPVRDLSPGGIGFVQAGKIGLDEQFVVLLPSGHESVAVLCQVAYYQPLGERVYGVGARFVRVLRQPAADAEAALTLPSQQPTALRRAAS